MNTGTITNNLKMIEFADMTEALLDSMLTKQAFGSSAQYDRIIELLEKQTFAKQKKFWKYFDSVTIRCAECGLPKHYFNKITLGDKVGAFCSRECAYKAMGIKAGE